MVFHCFGRSIWDAPSIWEMLLTRPLQTIITYLYYFFNSLHSISRSDADPIRIICISDSHTLTTSVPYGDILIHAGDLTNKGTVQEIQAQIDWLAGLSHPQKFAIAGNHDTFLDPKSRKTLTPGDRKGALDWKDIHYLQNNSKVVKFGSGRQFKIYGAPQIPQCGGQEFAFQYERGLDAWTDTVPDDIDILVTHTPPGFHLDLFSPWLGCPYLLEEIWRVKPLLHVFGHVHSGAGREVIHWNETQRVYERAMARQGRKGFLRQLISIHLWRDLIDLVLHGTTNVVWDRIWGGESRRSIMINAALMEESAHTLDHQVQVIDI